MNGDMWFESKENVGSKFTFRIKLPIITNNSSISSPSYSIKKISKQTKAESTINFDTPILIAEDNYMNQQVIKRILNNIGFTNLTIVDNGLKAVEESEKKEYPIILMDCRMPIMSGLEATQAIRLKGKQKLEQENDYKEPAIVALTADAYEETAIKCIDVGMNIVITKPINRKKLQEILFKYASHCVK